MIDLWNMKVSEYRREIKSNSELRNAMLGILQYGYKLKADKNIGINGKRACYGMTLLMNGKTTFDTESRKMVGNAVNNNKLDKTFISTGNYVQVAFKFWNVKRDYEYISIFFGDVVENLTDGKQAKRSGKGLSKQMKKYMEKTILDLTIEELTKQVERLFAESEQINDKEKQKRIKDLNCFIFAVNTLTSSHKEILDEVETDEKLTEEITYKQVTEISITEVNPPNSVDSERQEVAIGTIKALNEQEAALKEKNRKRKGIFGEKLAIQIEQRRLTDLGYPDLAKKIDHVAKLKDGLGYDIASFDIDEDGNEIAIYIEVKTTSGGINKPFYVSAREIAASEIYGQAYYIYRIFGVDEKTDNVQYYKLRGSIRESCSLKEVSYIAITKPENKNKQQKATNSQLKDNWCYDHQDF